MTRDRDADLFPVLEPPPGGWVRLRARLEQERRPRAGWWLGLATASAAAAAILLLVNTAPRETASGAAWAQAMAQHPVAARYGLGRGWDAPVRTPPELQGSQCVRQVPAAPNEIIYYQVASLAPAASARTVP